jgi:HAD superfamily hydrolase (TIGR01458 family)
MNPLTALLVDLDGVLYVEERVVPGAVEAIGELRRAGLRLRFVTNTTSRPRRSIVDRLDRLGFGVPAEEVLTPASLAVEHCRRHGLRHVALLMNDAVKEDFAEFEEAEHDVEAVIVGDLGRGFTYDTLNGAFRQLIDGAQLVALQKNRFWLTPSGLSLDVGPFVAALEYAAMREAVVVGKPAAGFFATVLSDLGVEPASAAMIGDDVESDVGGALAAGLAGVLVRTGKYRAEVVRASGIEPTLTLDSIADAPAALVPTEPRASVESTPRRQGRPRILGECDGPTVGRMDHAADDRAHEAVTTHGLHAVTAYLEGEGVAFEVIEHEPTGTARAESRAAHVPSSRMAKTVVLYDDAGNWVIAVVPASHQVDLEKLRGTLHLPHPPRLATEEEVAHRFPEVEVGAVPPVGPMLVAAAVVDTRLLEHAHVLCAGGDHRHAIRLDPRDIVRLADAHVGDVSRV